MRSNSLIVGLTVCAVGWLLFGCHNRLLHIATAPSHTTNSPALSDVTAQIEGRLQEAGAVPQNDNNLDDWQRAQNKRWWGKPLDPKEFWKGRVLWNDKKATSDAQRHGRLYPPMPYEDTNLPPYPDDDGLLHGGSPDGPNIDYGESSKERAFWDTFEKSHPRPPDQIEHEQKMSLNQLVHRDDRYITKNILIYNYPYEAFSSNALFWAYIQSKRALYQQFVEGANDPAYQTVIGDLVVDPNLVTQPLSADQMKAANSWKVAYLNRLQKENVDQSYINAYMQAWNLSSNEVFGAWN